MISLLIRRHTGLLLLMILIGRAAGAAPGGEATAPAGAGVPTASGSPPSAVGVASLPASGPIDLSALLRVARGRHPAVLAAENDAAAVGARLMDAGAFDNPVIEFELEDVPAERMGFGHGEGRVRVMQPFTPPGLRSARRAIASAEGAAGQARARLVLLEVLAEVRSAWVSFAHASESVRLQESRLASLRELSEVASRRAALGATSEAESARFRLGASEAELAIRSARRQRESAARRVWASAGCDPLPADRLAGELPSEFPELSACGLPTPLPSGHPAAEAGRFEVAVAEGRSAAARAGRYPGVDVWVSYGRNNASDENLVGAGIGFPLPLFSRNRSAVAEARRSIPARRHELESAIRRLRLESELAAEDYAISRDEVAVIEADLLPASLDVLSQTREAYASGKAGLGDLLSALQDADRLSVRLSDARRDAALAYSRLLFAAGADPADSNGVYQGVLP